MNTLVRVELTRYRSRRLILLILAAATVLTALVAFKTAWDTRPPSASEIATANAAAEADGSRSDIKQQIALCEEDPASFLDPGATADQCGPSLRESANSYLPRERLNLTGTLKGNGIGLALLVIALLIIAAGTYAGSDWTSGSIRNQVLFEPRRSRVWAAKAAAVGIASGLAALILLAAFWGALFAIAVDRDVAHGSAVVSDVAWHVARAVALAAGAGMGVFALTTIFRNSMATVSVLFAFTIGGELLTYLLPFDGVARWSPSNIVFGWLETRLEFFDTTGCANRGTCSQPVHISHLDAGLYLLALLLVAGAVSWATFRKRDI